MKNKTLKKISFLILAIFLFVISLTGSNITSAKYNAGTSVITITFSDSIRTEDVLLGRLVFDDDNGGPKADVVFTGGTILTGDTLADSLEISLIYGGIIDHWTDEEGVERDIWGNVVSLVNAVEALDFSSLTLVVDEGTFIDNNAEPFVDEDGNGIYSPAENYTDLNGNGIWDSAEELNDANGNDVWDSVEVYIDANENGSWDPPEVFTDVNGNGIWDDAEILFDDANVNGIWDSEDFEDVDGNGTWSSAEAFSDANLNGVWDPTDEFEDANSNGIWDDNEPFEDTNGNGTWDDAESFEDLNGDALWSPAETLLTDHNQNGIWDSTEVLVIDRDSDGEWDAGDFVTDVYHFNGKWDPGEEFVDVNNNHIWDSAETFSDDNGSGVWDPGESFDDDDGNGIWNPAEDFFDTPLNGILDEDAGETYEDTNDNGVYDLPDIYYDANGNGQWDRGDEFTDTNGNDTWDPAEPLTDIDGDSVWDAAEGFTDANGNGDWDAAETLTIDYNGNGLWNPAEGFTDANGNNTWDDSEPFSDDNENGIWDSTEVIGDPNSNGVWDSGESFDDNNGNGIWDGVEEFTDLDGDGEWDFDDLNGNGIWDNFMEGEPFTDDNGNGICDQEFFDDVNGNGVWDPPEGFIDVNNNGIWDPAEDFVDADENGVWFTGEDFTDTDDNGVWDPAEVFIDANDNGIWDPAESFIDSDGDSVYDASAEEFTDSNDNDVWDRYGVVPATSISTNVFGTEAYPILNDAKYDANINKLTLIFDRLVQFDQIPEDETFQNGPGNGNLDSGEDRNENGVLDKETNVNIFKVGFTDALGNSKNLEGLDQIVQTADSDTIEIFLTRNDSKRLETTLDISSLSVNLSEGAFVDTLYNSSLASILPVMTTLDSLPLFADSATYNLSENVLLISFRSKETNKRKVVIDPAPIYSKFTLSFGDSSMNLSGIDGNPFIQQDITLKVKLMLADQKELEMLIDDKDAEETLFLSMDEYAVYDEKSNGNVEVSNIPVTIDTSDNAQKQPPQIESSGIVYDAYTDILTLPWNMEVGFFNAIAIPNKTGVNDFSVLEGIALYDSSEDSLITFSQGEVYYPTSKDTTCIKLSEMDAELLENYPNRANLFLTLEPFTFYSASPHKNGNEAVIEDSLFVVNYRWDKTAPVVNEVLFNIIDSTLAITLNELVIVDLLYPEKFTFGGIEIDGEIVVDSAAQYVSNLTVKVSSSVYNDITNLDDNVKINPLFQSVAGAFVNADSTISGWIDQEANYGRKFWIKSFEAFAPPPELRFASLRSVGSNCDIYVDDQVWETKIDTTDLNAIVTAFDDISPNDSSKGIADVVREFVGGSEKDTDNNGKVTFVFTDILDEYGKGRNDTKSSLYVHGYSTMIDTLPEETYSNSGDIIYLDVDPMDLDPEEESLNATYNAIAHEFARMVLIHNKPNQEYWVIDGAGFMVQKKAVGDVKFFGEGTGPAITSGNQLTYIATGYQALKGRTDKYNVFLFLSYLQEKYSPDGTGWDIIQTITRSDSVGILAVSDALASLGYPKTVEAMFADYGLACYLDIIQVDTLYDGIYSFDLFDLQKPPSGKSASLLSWDTSIGKGAPYSFKDISPWSYNFIIMQGYSFDLAGNVNYLSPDLQSVDTLIFDGYDGINFSVKKLVLKSSFLNPMDPDYEVADFVLDDSTSYEKLPVTTDTLYTFKDTLDNATEGVQIMLLMVAKTDDAQPSATYDFVVSNITAAPDISDLYAYQNPGIQNFLDIYVVSGRRVYDAFGNEGPVVEFRSVEGDSGSLLLEELSSYDTDLVIYQTLYKLTEEGTYSFVYQGRDKSGNLFEIDSLVIVVDYYNPGTVSRMVLSDASFKLPAGSLSKPQFIVSGPVYSSQIADFPENLELVSDIVMFGPLDRKLNKNATVTFTRDELKDSSLPMSIYQFYRGKWRHIGAEIYGSNLSTQTTAFGHFAVLGGNHGKLDKELTLPTEYVLSQNYPNPFNSVTRITFSLPEPAVVRLLVYDILGREVARLVDGSLGAGVHEASWNGRTERGKPIASGVYLFRLTAGDFQQVRKMLLVK